VSVEISLTISDVYPPPRYIIKQEQLEDFAILKGIGSLQEITMQSMTTGDPDSYIEDVN
jgi:hypothetical protein